MSVEFAIDDMYSHLVHVIFARRIIHPSVFLVVVGDKEDVLDHTANVIVRLYQVVILQSLV